MAMMSQLARLRPARIAALAHRFARAAEVLGPAEALKVVVGARRGRDLQQLRVPGWPRPFWFRG
jgi:hypothetical protein